MKIKITIFVVVIGILIVSQQNIFACSCELPPDKVSKSTQIKKAKKESSAVFTGKVLSVTKLDKFNLAVKMEVKTKWKGIKETEVTIFTGRGDGDCGFSFEVGETYLIYAYKKNGGKLGTSMCQRTALLSHSQDEIKMLGTAKID